MKSSDKGFPRWCKVYGIRARRQVAPGLAGNQSGRVVIGERETVPPSYSSKKKALDPWRGKR